MHFEQDLCFIDSPRSGSQYINCIQSPFLSSLSSNVNLDLQQFVNLFSSLFGEKSLFCVMLDGPVPRFLSVYFKDGLIRLIFYSFQGAESPGEEEQQGDAET